MLIPEISIIVPVYKAEKYLDRCVQSIQGQTFSDWELLLVDDGSPDNSGKLCDQYAVSDSRIRVFHKQNGGVASAREVGMQNAQGRYSIHVDPDDWIDADTLKIMYEKANADNLGVVICDFLLEYQDYKVIDKQEPKVLSSNNCLTQLLKQELHGSLCNKLIRTELYKKYNLHFPNDMICWEDLYICCSIFMNDVGVGYVSEPFYHYDFFTNDNSMVRKTDIRGLKSQIKFCTLMQEILSESQQHLLNESKGLCKVTAFRANLLDEQSIRTLFEEINEWYINKYSKEYKKVLFYGLALLLRGCSISKATQCMRLLAFYNRIIRVVNKIFFRCHQR